MKKSVFCGGVRIGGGSPVSIQSMTNTSTSDVDASVDQIKRLEDAGCEIVRLAVPDEDAADAFAEIRRKAQVPLVADIHFDYRLALRAIDAGADKIRINPGNIGSEENVRQVVEKAKESWDTDKSGSEFRFTGKRYTRALRQSHSRGTCRKRAQKRGAAGKIRFRRYRDIS